MTKRDLWGTGGSGKAIGVSEVSPKRSTSLVRLPRRMLVIPRAADSQIYVRARRRSRS